MKTSPELRKHVQTFYLESSVEAAVTLKFTAKQDQTPLALRATPNTVSGTSPTIALAMTDDGSSVAGSQDSTTATAATTREVTFTLGQLIANGSAIVITLTPGGTDPVLTGVIVEYEWLE